MDINHAPISDILKVEEIYSAKDKTDVRYVCTTDLRASDVPADVFYRDTPHPQFGNQYFGIFHHPITGNVMITDADIVEDFDFGMIKDKDGKYWYSQSHHDCLFIDGKMIDGGRQYIRSSGGCEVFKIVSGKFVKEES
jgi:hypothetical protein